MEKNRFEVFTSTKTHDSDGKKVPDIFRKFLYDQENDEIFFPAIDQSDVLSASFDGVGIAMVSGHPFLPCGWLKQEYPRSEYETMEKNVRKCMEVKNAKV